MRDAYGHVIPSGNSILFQTRGWAIRDKIKVVSYKSFCSFYTEDGLEIIGNQ